MKHILLLTCAGVSTIAACTKKDHLSHGAVTPAPSSTAASGGESSPLGSDYAKAARILFKNRAVSASLYGIPEAAAGYHFASQLEDYSPEHEAAFRRQLVTLADKLAAVRGATPAEEDDRQVMVDLVNYYAGARQLSVGFIDTWMGHSAFVLNQINGPMIDIPNNLINSHVIRNVSDATDYISRLRGFRALGQSVIDKAKSDEKAGWIPPRVLTEKALAYLKGFAKDPADRSSLVKSFAKRLAAVQAISAEQQLELVKQAVDAVKTNVYPAYEALAAFAEETAPRGRPEAGIWAQPRGDEFYAYAIRRLGDSSLSAEEIHALGQAEVVRISAEMHTILKAQGYTSGTVGDRMTALGAESRFLYPNNDAGRQQLLGDLNGLIDEVSKKMPKYFASIPSYKVEVRRIPVAVQDSSAGGYYTPPTLDGSVPGIYWINLKDTTSEPKFGLKTLTYHEAVPGHHWQIALNLAQKSLPLLRRVAPYNAYVEGWALYSEQVAAEIGMYEDDPFGDLGRLKAELFRAARLVVDTGLHHKRWTREKAIDYMVTTTGTDPGDIEREVERYMAWPGQALGYKLGMLKILELRALARQRLGDSFDVKAFHELVLLGGAAPMSILQQKVESWIAAAEGSNP